MSEHFITLIPADPYFTPADGAFNKARELFAAFLATAEDTEGRIGDEVQFVDQGENFERVSCPKCGSELSIDWWQQAMNKSYESRFQHLEVITPCCGHNTSLNDLDYRWPAGFARCYLRARGPQQKEVPPEQIKELEQVIGTTLRQIWSHY